MGRSSVLAPDPGPGHPQRLVPARPYRPRHRSPHTPPLGWSREHGPTGPVNGRLVSPLHDHREPLAHADTCRGDAEAAASAGQFESERPDQPATGRAERVAQGDASAVRIDPGGVGRVDVLPLGQARSACAANASFNSRTSTSAMPRPIRASARFVASTGPGRTAAAPGPSPRWRRCERAAPARTG